MKSKILPGSGYALCNSTKPSIRVSMKSIIIFSALVCSLSFCVGPKKIAQSNVTQFDSITFHTTRCFGSCPQVALFVDKYGNMRVNRQFFVGKGSPDTAHSGNFAGKATPEQLTMLDSVLTATPFRTMKFRDVTCCDAPVRTIIIYSEGKRYYYKSMFPPDEAELLIARLREVGLKSKLARTESTLYFEE